MPQPDDKKKYEPKGTILNCNIQVQGFDHLAATSRMFMPSFDPATAIKSSAAPQSATKPSPDRR